VDEYIEDGDMIAAIQSRGAFMGVAHAILRLTYRSIVATIYPTDKKISA